MLCIGPYSSRFSFVNDENIKKKNYRVNNNDDDDDDDIDDRYGDDNGYDNDG